MERRQVKMSKPAGFRVVMALMAMGWLGGAAEAGPFSPIKVVNDAVITQFEYDQRLHFLQLLRQPGDLEKQAMDSLVDDRLRMWAAKQFGVKATPEQIKAGMEEFAGRANLTADKFVEIVGQEGIQPETFRDFVEAGLVWRDIVRGKYGASIAISDAQIDRALANFKPMAALQVRLAEISIPAVGAGREAALKKARALQQDLTFGGDFAAAARANSDGPTAGAGGALDWQLLSQLKPNAATAVRSLQPGQVSEPVVLDDKVVIYQMQEQRQQMTAEPSAVVVDYAEYLVADASEAAAVRAKVDSCNDLYTLAKGTDRLSRKTVPQAQLPKDVAGALATLDAGESSVALTRGNWRVFLMLCRRGAPEAEQPSRDEVRMQLTNQQLGARAEIYLEELRSEAIIKTP
jgi:peptidyl-prolyl cis-trans isomerase SurA